MNDPRWTETKHATNEAAYAFLLAAGYTLNPVTSYWSKGTVLARIFVDSANQCFAVRVFN